jgi:hypothetical protein
LSISLLKDTRQIVLESCFESSKILLSTVALESRFNLLSKRSEDPDFDRACVRFSGKSVVSWSYSSMVVWKNGENGTESFSQEAVLRILAMAQSNYPLMFGLLGASIDPCILRVFIWQIL